MKNYCDICFKCNDTEMCYIKCGEQWQVLTISRDV